MTAFEAGTLKNGSFDEVPTHELGHNFGLIHTNDGKGLMGEKVNGQTNVSIRERATTVGGEDKTWFGLGVNCIYTFLYSRICNSKNEERI